MALHNVVIAPPSRNLRAAYSKAAVTHMRVYRPLYAPSARLQVSGREAMHLSGGFFGNVFKQPFRTIGKAITGAIGGGAAGGIMGGLLGGVATIFTGGLAAPAMMLGASAGTVAGAGAGAMTSAFSDRPFAKISANLLGGAKTGALAGGTAGAITVAMAPAGAGSLATTIAKGQSGTFAKLIDATGATSPLTAIPQGMLGGTAAMWPSAGVPLSSAFQAGTFGASSSFLNNPQGITAAIKTAAMLPEANAKSYISSLPSSVQSSIRTLLTTEPEKALAIVKGVSSGAMQIVEDAAGNLSLKVLSTDSSGMGAT